MKVALQRWRSLDRKLPLLIAVAILATVVAFSASAYRLVQHVLLTSAGERLQGASAPLAISLSQSARQQRAHYARLARNPAIVDFLLTGKGSDSARRVLASGSQQDTARPPGRVELRNAQGEVVLDTVLPGAPESLSWIDRIPESDTARGGQTLISPLFAVGDTVVGAMAVAVRAPAAAAGATGDGEGELPVIGYIAETRAIRAAGVQSIRDLLGNGAALFVGSPGEGIWTDLEHPAAPPPASLKVGRAIVYRSSARGPGVGVATQVAGTPWLLWVEQPRASVLAPLTALLGKLSILAVIFTVAGALGAWALSRQVTRPIVALADAADRVDADPGAAAVQRPGDEVARLDDAFSRMSARVEESRGQLEGLVAERTARLQSALAELELAQQELVKKERLAMLGQLASAVGHELRNPLGVMTNAMYVIERCVSDGPPLAREYIELVRGQIAISERIVGDLLDTARVRAPEAQAVDLRSLVEEQLRRLEPTTTVAVDARLPDDLPAALIDPVQLSQILFNLMTNAAQAMGEGGTLTIAAIPDEPGRRVKLVVADTGPGIQPETLDRIFEPLFTTKARGLGLGLWVSRNLASANGATLEAASSPGEGATFTLDMPAAVEASTPAS
jgi:signal transduction histidine kinase